MKHIGKLTKAKLVLDEIYVRRSRLSFEGIEHDLEDIDLLDDVIKDIQAFQKAIANGDPDEDPGTNPEAKAGEDPAPRRSRAYGRRTPPRTYPRKAP